MTYVRYATACLLLLHAVGGLAGERTDPQSPFVLIAQNNDGWDIHYVPPAHPLMPVDINGERYFRFLTPGFTPNENDATQEPPLPVDAITLGIPFGAHLTAELLDPEFVVEENRRLAPHPSYEFTEDNEAVEVFRNDAIPAPSNTYRPPLIVTVEKPFTLREQHLAVVRVRPYQYKPATASLRRIVRATLRIRLTNLPAPFEKASARPHDPYFEDTYKSLVWNYEQAKGWRRAIHDQRPLRTVTDPTRDWFETGRTYYKIPIGTDGWYKVTRADLVAAGANLENIDLSSLKMFARGVQVPILVRPDTTIEFYARQNYGDSTYIDYYTDTSAYWLTWGGTAGVRFVDDSVTGVPATVVRSAPHTLHREENRGYFAGSSNTNEPIDIHTTPGETWYWQWFSINNEYTFSFVLDSLDASVPVCTLRVRLWGTTYTQSLPPQRARFWVNDSLAGDVDFGTRQAALFTAIVPTQWLRVGSNSLRIRNVNLGFGNTQFYLDWFEIDYARQLRALDNQLFFVASDTLGGNPKEFVVRGFSSPTIEVFDLSTRRRIRGTVISGDSIGGYTVTFLDTLSSARVYLVTSAARSVPSLRSKVFSDIRIHPSGADYIIITHSAFRPQAEQLAAQRGATRGVRAKVIDVDDIYDEFNYGVMNATKLKTFLRYAYDNWSPPAPSYVLMMGDASWDFRRYLGTASIKANYVPAYGYPAADNWFVCFDSAYSFLPSLYIGRIPCENVAQAQIAVAKVIAYDALPLDEWSKKFLFITGGVNPTEQQTFNSLTENTISTHVTSAPFGGVAVRVYKSTPGYIDGENKARLQAIFREGISFVSFTGHSGGRVWGVTPGHPNELQNTDGKWPFISSVTCNVGAFATPQNNVLAEDFLFADNRGAIASWASVSVGYVTYGWLLNSYWLASARSDSVREFGKLTTNAALRLWAVIGSGGVSIAMINLNPLVGDPLSRFPLPTRPDLCIAANDIGLSSPYPTPNDSSVTVRLIVNNYGTVSPDSVGITLTDRYLGATRYLLNDTRIRPTSFRDTVVLPWRGTAHVGLHTLAATLDPTNTISEVNELNNTAATDQYVYANTLSIVKPLNNMLVPPGVQRLVVTSPLGYDSSGFWYFFELDTVDSFDSPGKIVSGPIVPDKAKGEWLSPALSGGKVYFWRARTMHDTLAGAWVTSSFVTTNDGSVKPQSVTVHVGEAHRRQFARNVRVNTQPTDSGLIIAPRPPLTLYVRSVGFRYNQTLEYYSIVKANEQYAIGYWWELGSSFMVMRVNDFDGRLDFRSFNVASNPALADSMTAFLAATPSGNYIGIAAIFDGRTNVNENLRLAMDSLGATLFRSILSGQSYAFLGRKGGGMAALEQLTNDTAVVSLTVANYFSLANGSMVTGGVPIAASWDSLHWRSTGDNARTQTRLLLLGMRRTGGVDTLRTLPSDSADVSLAFLNNDSTALRYKAIAPAVLLSTFDANLTPRFTQWRMSISPPADLAVSARTLGETQAPVFQFPIRVFNYGFRTSDSVRADVYVYDRANNRRLLATAMLDSISVDSSRTVTVPISTSGMRGKVLLQAVVSPRSGGPDLVEENNSAFYTLYASGIVPPKFRVFSDGKLLMDGDYVPPQPTFIARVEPEEGKSVLAAAQMELFVNNRIAERAGTRLFKGSSSAGTALEGAFSPLLPIGRNELRFRLVSANERGEMDTLEHTMYVHVSDETKLIQVYSYPNPFARETYFTFVLAGSTLPEHMRIRIFTVGGRKIKEIEVPGGSLSIGFNQVYWDGRDADGDELANGYYFYEILIKQNGKAYSVIQKLAKAR